MQRFFALRPRNPQSANKVDRHRRASCTTKRPYTLNQATQRARELNDRENRPYALHAYRCRYCPAYHVGRLKPWLRAGHVRVWLELECELGERVWGNMMAENVGGARKRRERIAQRYNSRFRKVGYPPT